MSSWPQVREALNGLKDQRPRVLLGYTSPKSDPEPQPPFTINLTSTALPIAEDLHRRFGGDVRLRVGALPYPAGPYEPWLQPRLREPVAPDHELDAIHVALDGPLEVESGETARHALLITNKTTHEITVHTNGSLTADIVDLRDGSHVGGMSGFQTQPLVSFAIAPGATTRVPLLVGTDSYVPGLGYAIPPGSWGITVDLDLAEGESLRSPVLAFEVTASDQQPVAD